MLIVQSYEPGQCINVIDTDEDGNETVCGNPCNPSEQLCRDCRVYGHRTAQHLAKSRLIESDTTFGLKFYHGAPD